FRPHIPSHRHARCRCHHGRVPPRHPDGPHSEAPRGAAPSDRGQEQLTTSPPKGATHPMSTHELTRADEPRTEYSTPPVEICEAAQALWVSADLPGVAAGDVEVALHDDVLTFTGRVAESDHAFRRRFTLSDPSRFDTEHISAALRHGVLEV